MVPSDPTAYDLVLMVSEEDMPVEKIADALRPLAG